MSFFRLCFVLALCSFSLFAGEKVTLQLNWKHQFEFAGYYAAVSKGFYKDVGLDVTIKEANGTENPIESVLKHKAEYGVGNSDILLYRHKGYEPILLAVIFQHSPFCLLTLEDAKIKTPSDLIGKTVLAEHNANEIMGWLKRNGLTQKQVNIIYEPYDLKKLIKKDVDAITVYSTVEPYILQKMGIKYKIFHPIETQIDFYGDNLFTTEKELLEHPARVSAFREASLKGWKYAMAHPVEIAKLIAKEYKKDENSIDSLMYEAKAMQELMETDIMEPGYYSEERWRHIADTYAELGMLPQDVSFSGFFYKDRTIKYPAWLVNTAYISVLLVVISTLIIWNFYRLNRRLNANEARYHSMYESAPIAFILLDKELKVLQWNQKSQELFGFAKEEAVGKKVLGMLVPPDEQKIIDSKFKKMLDTKEDFSSINKNKTKDGNIITCEWTNKAILDEYGNIQALVCLALDVTERERMLSRLQSREDSFEHMINMAPFPIVISDYSTGDLIFANKTAADVMHESKLSLMSSKASEYWYDLIDRDIYVRELAKKGFIENYETRFKRKNGDIFWVQMSAVRVVSDKRDSAFISFIDISERKKIEDKLKESEEKYRLLAENAADVIWTIDMNGKFTYISPSVERLRGYKPEEIINQSVFDAIAPKCAKEIEDDVRLFFETKEVTLRRIEIEQPCKNGTMIHTEAVITPIRDKGGKLTSILGITRDVTERKKLKEDLAIKNAAVDFAANGFLITDTDGVIEYVNKAFSDITGYTSDEAVGKTPNILRSGEQNEVFWEEFWSAIASDTAWRGIIINKKKNGELYKQLTAVSPVKNEKGEIIRYVSILQDVTKLQN